MAMWLFVLIILTDKIHLVSQQRAGTLHRQEEDLSGSGGGLKAINYWAIS